MSLLSDCLTSLLKLIYPGVAFDIAGLCRLLLPILIAFAVSLAVYLVLKLLPGARRYAYTAVAAALIALIAAVMYFPVSLSQAGDFAADQIEQRLSQMQDSAQDGVTDADSAQ